MEPSCLDFDYQLKAPFCLTVSGSSQSGKSSLVARILERRLEIINVPIHNITYCYTEWQEKLFCSLKEKIPQIEFHKGIPEEFADGTDVHKIVVLDDLMHEVSKSPCVAAAFTRTSHHR